MFRVGRVCAALPTGSRQLERHPKAHKSVQGAGCRETLNITSGPDVRCGLGYQGIPIHNDRFVALLPFEASQNRVATAEALSPQPETPNPKVLYQKPLTLLNPNP